MRKTNYPDPIVAERIQQILWDNNLKDNEVAEKLNIERKSVIHYRKCVTNPSIKFIRYLCSNYNVSADWLLNLEGVK